jgi:hypothetical protein
MKIVGVPAALDLKLLRDICETMWISVIYNDEYLEV